jgi:DnaD/phage-associated family protein
MNDDLAKIDPLGRLLFIGLWTIADREGRLEDRPVRIKAETLPYDDCDVNQLLDDLAKHGFIIRYKVNGTRYIQITNFTKHQNPHKNEKDSEIPAPDLYDTSIVHVSEKYDTDTVPIEKRSEESGKQKCRNEDLAGEIQVQEKHHTSTVQERKMHSTNPADSFKLIPDSLNTDSLNTDSLNTDSLNPEGTKTVVVDEEEWNQLNQLFIDCFGAPMGPRDVEMVESYLKDGLSLWHVQKALVVCKENKGKTTKYVWGILNNWLNQKAFTKEAVEAISREFKAKSRTPTKVFGDDYEYKPRDRPPKEVFPWLYDDEPVKKEA